MVRTLTVLLVLSEIALAADEGRYKPRLVDAASAAGRYIGFKQVGDDAYGTHSLVLLLDAKLAGTLTWTRSDKDGERERQVMPLSDVRVEQGAFTAKVGGKRPASVPAVLKGRFVTQYPPANAKGPVSDGLLLEGGWFLSLSEP